nr:MAG TPA: hypothetical protein [Caudoviricetes sp.]
MPRYRLTKRLFRRNGTCDTAGKRNMPDGESRLPGGTGPAGQEHGIRGFA